MTDCSEFSNLAVDMHATDCPDLESSAKDTSDRLFRFQWLSRVCIMFRVQTDRLLGIHRVSAQSGRTDCKAAFLNISPPGYKGRCHNSC